MGSGLASGPARQHPDLTVPSDRAGHSVLRGVLFALLAVDGIITALVAALFLPARLGTVPFPVSALVAGAMNFALVWAALQWSASPRVAGLPLWTFLATVAVLLLFGGPGGDIIFANNGLGIFSVFLLTAAGAVPAAWLLRSRTEPV